MFATQTAADPVSTTTYPNRVISVSVDAEYLYTQPGGPQKNIGIYMMDNNVVGGSEHEGERELYTKLEVLRPMAWNVRPISEFLGNTQVEIVAVEISHGTNIFGNWGRPKKQPAGSDYQWLATPFTQGRCTYQLKISITVLGAPAKYYWWDPYLDCVMDLTRRA